MYSFVFDLPTRVLFGAGQLNHLHEQKLPGKKALIVTSNGTSAKKYGYLGRVESELDLAGVEHVLFDEIRPNPTCENVMDGAQKVKDTGCDFIVALGGGSVMDCSKCIALMVTNPGHIWDYSPSTKGGHKTPAFDAIPTVCITTSAGTGSEVDFASVITNEQEQEKSALFFPSMFPKLSIVDSDLMMSVPPAFTAYQGMDAFFHASESILNKNQNPMGEMYMLKAIALITESLPIAYADGANAEARANMGLANTLAGIYMMCVSGHRIEHGIGSFHDDLPHGAGLIMIAHAYYTMLAERKAAEEKMIKMAKAMGVENPTSGMDFVKALDELIASVECADLKMSAYGVTEEELPKISERLYDVTGGNIMAEPIELSKEDYLEILRKSFK